MSELTKLEETLYCLGYIPNLDEDDDFKRVRINLLWEKFYLSYNLVIHVIDNNIEFSYIETKYIDTELKAKNALSAFNTLQADLEVLKEYEN